MDFLISLFVTSILGVIYLIIGLNCGDLCKKIDMKITGKKDAGGAYFFGLIFNFCAVVYYIGKYIAEKKD